MDGLSTKGQMIDQIDLRGVPHSGFDRSNHNFFTGKLGKIIPTRIDEVYPGDRIKGAPQIVANFEPLVAPLMANMVLKQESFFVPYILLWKNAWKFFTGKNGFSESMPSISPRAIYDAYVEQIYGVIWGTNFEEDATNLYTIVQRLHDIVLSPTVYAYEDFDSDYDALLDSFLSVEHAVYNQYKMVDLIHSSFEPFFRFVNSQRYKELRVLLNSDTTPLTEWKNAAYDYAIELGNMLNDMFLSVHGPSSVFDYLGWPVVTEVPVPSDVNKSELTNYFAYYLYMKVFLSSAFTEELNSKLRNYFSQVPLNFMPFKAYYLVWYWNYRDQLLETDILDPQEDDFLDGEITMQQIICCTLLRVRCWFKDAYTTALTNTGDGNLLVPTSSGEFSDLGGFTYYTDNGELVNTSDAIQAYNAGATYAQISNGSITYNIPMNYLHGAFVNSSENSSDSNFISLDLFDRIKRLRSVIQKRLILGYETEDVVYSSFMVRMSNMRAHMPELLGQSRDMVQISTVVNNTSTAEQIAGDKTATAYAHGQMSDINYFSEDWGFYIQIATIMPIQSYAGGMQRLYLKKEPFDYMWPEFATMGMDAIYNVELAALGSRLTDTQALQVFGYQGRYYDLKYRQDEEHGRLLTDLNYLTFSREFDQQNPPKLNYQFVHCWPRLDGFVLSDPNVDVFRADCYTAQGWERRLPVPSEIIH